LRGAESAGPRRITGSREIEANAGALVEATVRLSPGEGCTIDADA
jgi:hypothetical protein